MFLATRKLWCQTALVATTLVMLQAGDAQARFNPGVAQRRTAKFPKQNPPNKNLEFDSAVRTRRMPPSHPDRSAEALNFATGIIGLVQTAAANRPQQEYVPETVQYQPQYVPQTVQYEPQYQPQYVPQMPVAQEPVVASPPPTLTPAVETTVKIKNLTEKPQNYAVRRAGSHWGKYTLAAGAEHKFVIPAEELEVHYLTGKGSESSTISVPGDHLYAFAVDQGKVGLYLADPE